MPQQHPFKNILIVHESKNIFPLYISKGNTENVFTEIEVIMN